MGTRTDCGESDRDSPCEITAMLSALTQSNHMLPGQSTMCT